MAELRQETEPRDWYHRISHDERHLETEWRHFKVDERAYDAAKDALGTVPGDFFLRRLTEDVAEALTRIGKEHPGRDFTVEHNPAHIKYSVDRHPAFEFRGPSGNAAITDLTVLRRGDDPPVVVATERRDNPGISITNGAERPGAQVLTRLFPERAGEAEPFILIEHHPSESVHVGGPDYEAIDPTFQRVHFADFHLRDNGAGGPNIGRVVEWADVDRRSPETQQLAVQQLRLVEPQSIRSIPKEAHLKDTLRPWEAEQIGEYYLSQSHTQTGTDGNRYQIEAGTYPIVGKVSTDGHKRLLDTALVYTGHDVRTREEALIPMKMPALEIVQLQAQGKAKVNEDFRTRVEGLAKGVEQGRELTVGHAMRR